MSWVAEVSAGLEFYIPEKATYMVRIPILSFLSGIFSTKVLIETQIKDKNMSISDCSINHAPLVKLSTMGHIGESITSPDASNEPEKKFTNNFF